MEKYVERLIKCGYKRDRATRVCEDFVRNLSVLDLQLFVESTEEVYRGKHVEKV